MKELKGYTFQHVEDSGCSDNDCIVIETAVDTASDNLIVSNVYKQTADMFYTLYSSGVFETDDLAIRCARCGAPAITFRD